MNATASISGELYSSATLHLRRRPEQVGFFFADYMADERRFELREWWPLADGQLAHQSDRHLEISDKTKIEAIKRAWSSGLVLVEAHSHGSKGRARFSWSDIAGLRDWVPHVRWRLRGRPYVAIVLAGETLDALAWIDETPEQLTQLHVDAGATVATTGLSLEVWNHDV